MPDPVASSVRITVSIISHGHGPEVLMLLNELRALPDTAVRRVILTLNQPEPQLAAQLQRHDFPFALVLCENERPLGFGANHNRAFAKDGELGASEAFAVLNPDVHFRGHPLAAMAEALNGHASAGAVYPIQLDSRGAPSDSERLVPTPARLMARYFGSQPREVVAGSAPEWVNAACLLVRREAYADIHGFDERFHMYCEDVDFCLRLQLAGWSLVRADGAVIEHVAHRASHRNVRHLAWHLSSLRRLWRSDAYRQWMRRSGSA